jgi:hypothetical protein
MSFLGSKTALIIHPDRVGENSEIRALAVDECNRDFATTELKRYHLGMEYKGIWIVFLALWLVLGAAVAVFPVAVARLLRGRRDLPPSRWLKAWRLIGVVMAVGSVAKLVSVLASQ